MKTIKNVFVFLLALTVLFALGVNAFAAGIGTITVSGSINGKTYDAFKIFDLTYSGTDPDVKAAYEIDADWVDFFTGTGAEYITTTNTGNSLNPVLIGGVTNYINITGSNVAAFAQKALVYAVKKTPDVTATATADPLVFRNLDLGYYLLYPQGATDINTTAGYASLCSLTSTTPTNTVNVKATYPTITKNVDDNLVDIGQRVKYTITGKVPDTTGFSTYDYTVSDTLSAGLTINSTIAELTVEIDGTEVAASPTFTTDPITGIVNGFTVDIDVISQQANVGKTITVEYYAVVNSNAVIGSTGNANKANLEYSNDPTDNNSKTTSPDVVANVYTTAIEINKVDGANNATKLEGAKFVLRDSNGKYYKFTAANGATPESVEWLDSSTGATEVTTDNTGKAYFKGLEDGTYNLIETVAPAGYNLLTNPISAPVSYVSQSAVLYSIVTVENNSGAVLPTTGSIGTTIFYVVGGLLVTGAIVLLVTKKRMSANKD